MKPVVFIHTNAKQYVGAKVAEYSFKKMSPNRDKFDVKLIQLEDYPALSKREGKSYLREGEKVVWRNADLQSFTPLRFLPPQLMDYQGRAIVTDPDVFALTDIYELLTCEMNGKAILCRQIVPADSKPAYYASSVMLLDCSKLTHWQWEKNIEEMFRFQRDYRPWISLLTESEDSIGLLEEEWNHYDTLNEKTKLLHNTGRITQPWKTGLPIDFTPQRRFMPGKKWRVIPRPWIDRTKAFIRGQEYMGNRYIKHPDPNQEKFFFSLLRECLEQGIFTEEYIRLEISKKHLRLDTLDLVHSLELKEKNEVHI